MLFIVQFEDVYNQHPERLPERNALMEAHLTFLAAHAERVVASGALRDSEDSLPLGGIWIVIAQRKEEVERLTQEDPFWKAGLRKSVRVSVWGKAFWSPAFAHCVEQLSPS
jgi:uncharacterized protein